MRLALSDLPLTIYLRVWSSPLYWNVKLAIKVYAKKSYIPSNTNTQTNTNVNNQLLILFRPACKTGIEMMGEMMGEGPEGSNFYVVK